MVSRERLVHWISRIVDALAAGASAAGGGAVVAMMVVMTADAIGRKVARSVPGALDAGTYLMVAAVYLPLAYVQMRGGHVSVTIFTHRLPARVQAFLDAQAAILGAGLFGLMTWLSWWKALDAWSVREYTVGIIDFPIWPFRFLFPIGAGLFVLQLVCTALRKLKKAFSQV